MSNKLKYLEEFEFAKKVSIEVGKFLKDQDSKIINSSDAKDIKLELDKTSEEKIINSLKIYDYSILSEENGLIGQIKDNKPVWIIDPIDGTLNYSRNNPTSCISIALYEGSEPIFGIIYDFNANELFTGYIEFGAWLNKIELFKKETNSISQSILATGFPTYLEHDTKNLTNFINYIQRYKKIRMIGSAALSLAYVAAGRFDTYIEKNIKLWDVAAGIAINKTIGNDITFEIYENYLMNVEVGVIQ